MKITIRETTTTIEAETKELQASNTLAQNIERMLSRCFRCLDEDPDAEADGQEETDD